MDTAQLTVYRGCTPVVDAEYNQETDHSPSEVIVDALATAVGVNSTDLPPLYEYVDLEAIDSLFDHAGGHEDAAILGFRVESWNVFVRADGRIRVCDGTQPTAPEPVFEPTTSYH